MLFEIHDILLHRMWKAAYKARRKFLKKSLSNSMWGISHFQQFRSGIYYWAEKTTARWYFNHYPKLHFRFP